MHLAELIRVVNELHTIDKGVTDLLDQMKRAKDEIKDLKEQIAKLKNENNNTDKKIDTEISGDASK